MRRNEYAPELSEFVSDYLAIDDDGAKPDAREIATAYVDNAIADDATKAEIRAAVDEMTSQIGYYLP